MSALVTAKFALVCWALPQSTGLGVASTGSIVRVCVCHVCMCLPVGAVRRVRPLLGALALAGRGAAACVGKACAALLAKKSAQGKRVATGLEATIRTLQVQLGSTGTTSEEIRMIRYQLQVWCTAEMYCTS